MTFLRVRGVSKMVRGETVLDNVSFSQHRRQRVVVAGETGSGKSTLLKIIAGLAQADSGEVLFNDTRVAGAEEKLVPGHPSIAYLSQHFELPKFLRVGQVLHYAEKLPDADASGIYQLCQIDHLLRRKTDELSGGERQRIALAKLLIGKPSLFLLDEPYSNLDQEHKRTLKVVIDDASRELDITCMLVSHDPSDTLPWAERIIVLRDGKIAQEGTSHDLYTTPADAYAGALFGKYNVLGGEAARLISGIVPPAGKSLFLRPETIVIGEENEPGLRGTVRDIRFFGGHCEIDVVAEGQLVCVSTTGRSVQAGDEVVLCATGTEPWFIPA
jgi:ABC-type Fe3+/spermidine/putrescine transport system ATPase subunit